MIRLNIRQSAQAIDVADMHSKADDAPCILVHHNHYPMGFRKDGGLKKDGLAAKQVHAPQVLWGVADRGQPNNRLRRLSSTMARIISSDGPFGPGLRGTWRAENRARYLRRTRHWCSFLGVEKFTPAAVFASRPELTCNAPNPRTIRSTEVGFGARRRLRMSTSNCCCISKFSATGPRSPS